MTWSGSFFGIYSPPTGGVRGGQFFLERNLVTNGQHDNAVLNLHII